SAAKLAPCSRSSAWPETNSALTSNRAISRTTPPVCKAKAAQEPTSPPPPIMLTFILRSEVFLSALGASQDRGHKDLGTAQDAVHETIYFPLSAAITRSVIVRIKTS